MRQRALACGPAWKPCNTEGPWTQPKSPRIRSGSLPSHCGEETCTFQITAQRGPLRPPGRQPATELPVPVSTSALGAGAPAVLCHPAGAAVWRVLFNGFKVNESVPATAAAIAGGMGLSFSLVPWHHLDPSAAGVGPSLRPAAATRMRPEYVVRRHGPQDRASRSLQRKRLPPVGRGVRRRRGRRQGRLGPISRRTGFRQRPPESVFR